MIFLIYRKIHVKTFQCTHLSKLLSFIETISEIRYMNFSMQAILLHGSTFQKISVFWLQETGIVLKKFWSQHRNHIEK